MVIVHKCDHLPEPRFCDLTPGINQDWQTATSRFWLTSTGAAISTTGRWSERFGESCEGARPENAAFCAKSQSAECTPTSFLVSGFGRSPLPRAAVSRSKSARYSRPCLGQILQRPHWSLFALARRVIENVRPSLLRLARRGFVVCREGNVWSIASELAIWNCRVTAIAKQSSRDGKTRLRRR